MECANLVSPIKLRHLNTWFSAIDCLGRIKRWGLVGRGVSLGASLRFQKCPTIPCTFSLSLKTGKYVTKYVTSQLFLLPCCHGQHGSRDGLQWSRKRMNTDTCAHAHTTEIGCGLYSLMEKLQHPGSLGCVKYTFK